jgi:hypothetical protein
MWAERHLHEWALLDELVERNDRPLMNDPNHADMRWRQSAAMLLDRLPSGELRSASLGAETSPDLHSWPAVNVTSDSPAPVAARWAFQPIGAARA